MTAHRGRPGAALLLLQDRETDHRRQVAPGAAAASRTRARPLATSAADRSRTAVAQQATATTAGADDAHHATHRPATVYRAQARAAAPREIGRAWCRDRGRTCARCISYCSSDVSPSDLTGARLPPWPLPLPELGLGPLPPPLPIDPGPLLPSRPPPPLPVLTMPTTLPTVPPLFTELRLEPPRPEVAIPPPRLPTAASRVPVTLPTSVAVPSLTSATGARASIPEEPSLALASAGALALAPPSRVRPFRAISAAVARARAP